MTGDELAARIAAGELSCSTCAPPASRRHGGLPLRSVQGHIPARSTSTSTSFAAAGAGVRDLLAERGLDPDAPVVCYCHSGGRSAYATALLQAAGVAAENYDGSWHEWSRRGTARRLPA